MPKKKIQRILNVVPSRDTHKDWKYEHAVEAGPAAGPAAAFPPTKDLRATWWDIGDQVDSGSCVGWATADGVLRWHFTQANRLAKTEKLSPRFTWMASKETDEYTSYPETMIEAVGTSLKAALEVSRKFGAATMTTLPFRPELLYRGKEQTFYSLIAQFKIAGYYNLTPASGKDPFDMWRDWIANHGPILTRLGVDATWDNVTSNGKLDVYQPNTIRGGHAVALVGYTKDRFIVRNSWNKTWADKGFAYASLAYAKAAFTEAFGVTI
jgi:hypothetical protein